MGSKQRGGFIKTREAKIIKDKKVIVMPDGETYLHPSLVEIKGLGWFEEYANGDSTPYIQAYDMPEVKDVYRGRCATWAGARLSTHC